MIDVYFCTMDYGRDFPRMAMARKCAERWKQEIGIRFNYTTPDSIGCTREQFQRQRRIHADATSKSSIYVVSDDDCLLGESSPILPMIQLMGMYPEFQVISLMPENANIMPWTPEEYKAFANGDVWEHVSVGQVRFCRKDLLKFWPEQVEKGYDNTQCERIRTEGKRSGYAVNYKMNHLGEGQSSIW